MTVHAPFNFVPLASWVLYPEWSNRVSHDLPLQEGLCGTIGFELTAHTPILVGDENIKATAQVPGEVSFFKLPDGRYAGRYAIPGSSLKGMIKNVLSIATFSRMKAVDDQKFSVRDLNPSARELYGQHMTDGNPHNGFKSKVCAGWLKFEANHWQLFEAKDKYVRVEQSKINRDLNASINFQAFDAETATKDKYDAIRAILPLQKVRYTATDEIRQKHHTPTLIYRDVTSLSKWTEDGNGDEGYLVVTGQPSRQKHMEFVFTKPGKTVDLSESVINDFLTIHGDNTKTDSKSESEWDYLKKYSPFPSDFGIPVFYINEDNNTGVRAIGLAQMFKLAYKHGVHDLISNSYHNVDNNKKDFVETLFGCIGDTQAESLKGRVSFDYAVCSSNTVTPIRVVPTVLNSPKASYYPIYVKQENNGDPYTTYMDDNAEIQGQKRYPVRNNWNIPAIPPTAQNNTNIQVNLYPLPANTTFKGKLRFHNLMPEELGAIIWALEWGGNELLRHSLGMGKPFGLGQVSICITRESIDVIHNNIPKDRDNQVIKNYDILKDCVDKFKLYMEQQSSAHAPHPNIAASTDFQDELAILKQKLFQAEQEFIVEQITAVNWESSDQMKQLLAMADPIKANAHNLNYMSLGNGNRDDNEFINAKTLHHHIEPYEP